LANHRKVAGALGLDRCLLLLVAAAELRRRCDTPNRSEGRAFSVGEITINRGDTPLYERGRIPPPDLCRLWRHDLD
jgi:hypothetical protein